MRSLKRWLELAILPLACLALVLVLMSVGQEKSRNPAAEKAVLSSAGEKAQGGKPSGTRFRDPRNRGAAGYAAPGGSGVMSGRDYAIPSMGVVSAGMRGPPGMASAGGTRPPGYVNPLAAEWAEAEGQANAALEAYKQTEDATAQHEIKASLTKALECQFDVRQKRRVGELEEIEARVKKLRDLIEKRNQTRQTIVSKRVDQLLSEIDGLGWTSPDETSFLTGGAMSMPPGMGPPMGMGSEAMRQSARAPRQASRRRSWAFASTQCLMIGARAPRQASRRRRA